MAARNLGTLTLDLVARTAGFVQGMDRAARESEAWRRTVRREIDAVANKLKALSAISAAALGAMAVQTVNAAKEISQLAQVSGTTERELQRLAAGAKIVGVEQGKLADIFKDTNDKVGDFLQTGGGALSDFFENIAPQIGVTADAFRDLSGPEALQLYFDSLEKANIPQADMIFYMEAIASDASLLIPLLRDGGRAFEVFGDAAEDAGAVMSDSLLDSVTDLEAAQFLLQNRLAGIRNEIMAEFIPAMGALTGAFIDADERMGLFSKVGEGLVEFLKNISISVTSVAFLFKNLGLEISGTANVIKTFFTDGFDAAKVAFYELESDLQELSYTYTDFLDSLNKPADSPSSVSRLSEEIRKARSELSGLTSGLVEVQKGSGFGKLVDGAKSFSQEVEGVFKEIVVTAERYEPSAFMKNFTIKKEETLFPLQEIEVTAKRISDSPFIENWKEQQIDFNRIVDGTLTREEWLVDSTKERLELLKSLNLISEDERESVGRRVIESAFTESPEEQYDPFTDREERLRDWYDTQLELLNLSRENQLETNEYYNEKELELTQDYIRQREAIEQARADLALKYTEDIFGSLTDITREAFGEQASIYKAMFALEKAAAIARSIVAIQGAIANAGFSAPFPQNLANMAIVASSTANIVSTIASTQIEGQAHDGMMSIPRTGTYILEKGERVIPEGTAALMDAVLNDVNQLAPEKLGAINKVTTVASGIASSNNNFKKAPSSGSYIFGPGGKAVPAETAKQMDTALQSAQNFINNAKGQAHDGMMSVPSTGKYMLEQGERVMPAETTAKMDSVLNNINSNGQAAQGGQNIRIVNSFDTDDVVDGYMASDMAEKRIMNVVRRNQRTIRRLAS